MDSIKQTFKQRLSSLFSIDEFQDAHSILLFGSTAREEQSCLEYDGSLQCFSDIEALVIYRNSPATEVVRKIERAVRIHESSWDQRSPLFHLDIGVVCSDELRRLPRSILTYEMKERGVVLRGEDVRTLLPKINAHQIDIGSVNELILIRLWSMFLFIPRNILFGRATGFEKLAFRYVLCRNTLEILTILYANLGILLPSYVERFMYLKKIEQLPKYKTYFGHEFTQHVRTALQGKLHPSGIVALCDGDLYRRTIDGYFSLIGFLIGKQLSRDSFDWDSDILSSSLELRDTRLLRRNVHELWQAWLMSQRLEPRFALRWALAPRRRLAICFLLHMHLSLSSWLLKKNNEAIRHLEESTGYLCEVWPEAQQLAENREKGLPNLWLEQRRQFIPFMTHFYRYNRNKDAYFNKIHHWTDIQ